MTQDELIELLRKHEWHDVESKEAQHKNLAIPARRSPRSPQGMRAARVRRAQEPRQAEHGEPALRPDGGRYGDQGRAHPDFRLQAERRP